MKTRQWIARNALNWKWWVGMVLVSPLMFLYAIHLVIGKIDDGLEWIVWKVNPVSYAIVKWVRRKPAPPASEGEGK